MKSIFAAALLAASCYASKEDPGVDITDRIYFDITFDGQPAGRITIGLYRYLAPLWVNNFLKFCDGSAGEDDDGSILWYKGSELYSPNKGEFFQGGDVENQDGTG